MHFEIKSENHAKIEFLCNFASGTKTQIYERDCLENDEISNTVKFEVKILLWQGTRRKKSKCATLGDAPRWATSTIRARTNKRYNSEQS